MRRFDVRVMKHPSKRLVECVDFLFKSHRHRFADTRNVILVEIMSGFATLYVWKSLKLRQFHKVLLRCSGNTMFVGCLHTSAVNETKNRCIDGKRKTKRYNEGVSHSISYPHGNVTPSTPVVFLLGWMGSNLNVLQKFYPLYSDPPCIIISYAVSVYDGFCRHPNSPFYLNTANYLVELLQEHELQYNPVLVHLFCNGGYTIYQGMADPLQQGTNQVVGVTLDSAPGRNSYRFGFSAIRSLPHVQNPLKSFLGLSAFSMIFASWKFRQTTGITELNKVYRIMSTSTKHLWPHLFLYSSADLLVPPSSVEEMAEKRKRAGVTIVDTHDFGTSAHVNHYKLFPEIYEQQVYSFLQKCL